VAVNYNQNIAALILAGGDSNRMGFPKPWLKKDEHYTFLSSIVAVYKKLKIQHITVVLNQKFATNLWQKEVSTIQKEVILVKNSAHTKERLYSIYLGLKKINEDNVILHQVDNPFIEVSLIRDLLKQRDENKITIPSFHYKNGHPVIIPKTVKDEIINNYQSYTTLKEIFSNYPKNYVAVQQESILININTPQDYAKYVNVHL